jgi:hypothetical protein
MGKHEIALHIALSMYASVPARLGLWRFESRSLGITTAAPGCAGRQYSRAAGVAHFPSPALACSAPRTAMAQPRKLGSVKRRTAAPSTAIHDAIMQDERPRRDSSRPRPAHPAPLPPSQRVHTETGSGTRPRFPLLSLLAQPRSVPWRLVSSTARFPFLFLPTLPPAGYPFAITTE